MADLESMNARFERLVMLALALSAGAGPQPERAIDMHQRLVFLGGLDRLGVRVATTGVDIARLQAGDRWQVTHRVATASSAASAVVNAILAAARRAEGERRYVRVILDRVDRRQLLIHIDFGADRHDLRHRRHLPQMLFRHR